MHVHNDKDKPLYTELTGSLPPLTGSQPKLLGSISYANLLPGTTKYIPYSGVLAVNARKRTFFIGNNLDINTGAIAASFSSSFIPALGGQAKYTTIESNGVSSTKKQSYHGDENGLGVLNTVSDTITLSITIGATAPTSGDIKIYVAELI